ncbi:DUF6449 domain-containing protein [Clostridium sp. E02]|uniref:DUF6449 domain-containing protein n=1 Tax=Clostridium sp. E02 TaxID=2487134 RepID=UPI000F52E0BF|nr:DUF6449 domain-containing protein [Clostridium sp. E02]
MTSKSLFFNLVKEDGKRRLWSIALGFLLFFFIMPVKYALLLGNSINLEKSYDSMLSQVIHGLRFESGWLAILIILLSFIMGITSFSYLHSRQKVDLYHGIPVNRNHLFWSNYINGILIVAGVYAVNLVLTFGVIAAYRISPGEVFGSAVSGFLLFMIYYVMIYSVTVLAMILTGNVIVGMLGTVVLQFYSTSVILILQMYFSEFFLTRYNGEGNMLESLLLRSSPIVLYFNNIESMNMPISLQEKIIMVLVAIGIGIIVTAFAFFLYKKRGLESAKKAMAFSISMPIIRILMVILFSLSGGLFFWLVNSSIGWAAFGLICGMMLSHCIIEIIYHFDFRKLFGCWKQMIISGLLAAIIFCCFCFDLFGYDSYIPNESSIKSVAIYFDNMSNWIDYGEVKQNKSNQYYWDYINGSDYVLDHMELTDKTPVLSLVRDEIKRNQVVHRNVLNKSRVSTRTYYTDMDVKYTLVDGREVYRSYELEKDDERSQLVKIYENPEFIRAFYPIMNQTPDDTSRIRIRRGSQSYLASSDRNGRDKAMTEKILLAYQKDLSDLKVETMEQENPTASIQFLSKMQAKAETIGEQDKVSRQYNKVLSQGYYPIYPSFHRTLDLLKESQVNTDSWSDKSGVFEINIDKTQLYGASSYKDDDSDSMTITEKEEIRQIMEHAVIAEYSNMNPFYISNEDKQIRFTAIDATDGIKSELQYVVPIEYLPQSIKDGLIEEQKLDQ